MKFEEQEQFSELRRIEYWKKFASTHGDIPESQNTSESNSEAQYQSHKLKTLGFHIITQEDIYYWILLPAEENEVSYMYLYQLD